MSTEKYDDHMELLLIKNEEKVNPQTLLKERYVYIKDFNRFMFSFSSHKSKKHFCMHCLQCLYSEIDLQKHVKDYIVIHGVQAVEMPNKGEKVYFKNRQKQLPAPFTIYADLKQ